MGCARIPERSAAGGDGPETAPHYQARRYLFAVFQAQEKVESAPQYAFRIQDSKTLLVADRGHRKPEQVFNNRSLEKLFQEFDSLKFFLSRDKLREVIVRR